jgi:hypothetical protein
MYGEGYDFSQLYIQLPGEQVGEMAVGIESWENEDEPFWPQVNTATYKEVWSHASLRWLWIAADCRGPAMVNIYVQYTPKESLTFTNALSGQSYTYEPEYKTGRVTAKIPAGKYLIRYKDIEVNKTFVAAKCYEINSLMGFIADCDANGSKVTIKIKTQGKGKISLSAKASNIKLDDDAKTVIAGDTVTFNGVVETEAKPWVVLFTPNGDINEAFDVYGK